MYFLMIYSIVLSNPNNAEFGFKERQLMTGFNHNLTLNPNRCLKSFSHDELHAIWFVHFFDISKFWIETRVIYSYSACCLDVCLLVSSFTSVTEPALKKNC